jgi:hypothetical protein
LHRVFACSVSRHARKVGLRTAGGARVRWREVPRRRWNEELAQSQTRLSMRGATCSNSSPTCSECRVRPSRRTSTPCRCSSPRRRLPWSCAQRTVRSSKSADEGRFRPSRSAASGRSATYSSWPPPSASACLDPLLKSGLKRTLKTILDPTRVNNRTFFPKVRIAGLRSLARALS